MPDCPTPTCSALRLGTSLSAAFAESPRFWVSRLPREIKRIYDIVRSTAP